MDLKQVELLAPAGDMERVQTALRYGADAIYCGGPLLQLRAEIAGFSMETLADALAAVHAAGKRMYVTVNSFVRNDEVPLLADYARRLRDLGADALIVSDIGAIAEIKAACPDLEVHVSTQANCMNYRAARVYHDMGASRIILARELSIEQIAELRAKTPADLTLEAFVHGAMCMSYSGRCLLSAYLAGRSGNRGECAQTCRWNYYLMEEKRPGEYFPVEEDAHGSAILSSKELCAIGFLDKLAEAGVSSFKIEGRMRTPFYVATVVNAYRMAMDGRAELPALMNELNTVSHRPFSSGFYLGDPAALIPDTEGYIRDWLFVASVLSDAPAGEAEILTRNPFAAGDTLQLLQPGETGRAFELSAIMDEDGNAMQRSAQPMRRLRIPVPFAVKAGDILRKRV